MADLNDAVNEAKSAYNKAESEVDGFIVRNKFTVSVLAILAGVAIALVVLTIL